MAKQMICQDCGNVGKPKSDMKGSIITEFFLWCLFLLPGIIYTVWRFTTVGKACRSCRGRNIISTDSPRGRVLAQQFAGAAKTLATLALIALFSSTMFAQEIKSVVIKQGTEIQARLANQLDSDQVHVGDEVTMDVLEDLKIQGVIVIPRGSIVIGHVTEAKGARRMGRGGKLDISFETVTAGDGTKVPVSGERFSKGKGGYGGGSMAGAAAAGLFFPPAGALLLLKHGHSSVISAGAILTVEVTADTSVAGTLPKETPVAAVPATVSVAQSARPKGMMVITPDGRSVPLGAESADGSRIAAAPQPESLGEIARQYREQKAAQQK